MLTVLPTRIPASSPEPHRAARASGRRMALCAAAAVALVVATLASGAPATAARAPLPFDGGGVPAPVSVEAVPVSAAVSAVESTRSALASLPNSADIPIDQILKNLATGLMP